MYNGILNVYKEKGFTSHDVVAKLRGILKQKKIGHTGTLDPDAEGVLPVCLGNGTRLCDMLPDNDKVYKAVLLLGIETDTQDISGNVLNKSEVKCTETEVIEAVSSFVGEYDQIPPMYSALKVNGKKLYELAREGRTVERKPRHVEIYSIIIDEISLPRVCFTVSCSKGTYIRTLCDDIGKKLGSLGCMEKLVRTKANGMGIEGSLKLCDIERLRDENKLNEHIIPVDYVFRQYPKALIDDKYNKLVYNGNQFDSKCIKNKEIFNNGHLDKLRVYDSNGKFVGLYEYTADKDNYKPVKMFLGD